MRILELHYSTAGAGAERMVVDLCNEMSKEHDVTLCTIEDDSIPGKSYYKCELFPEVKYINLKCRSGNDIKGFWMVYKTIRELMPDVVHAHTDALNLWLPSLMYRKCKYFHTIHSLAKKRQWKPWLTPIYRLFYKARIKAITISKACQQSYIDLYKLDNGVMIENGRAKMEITDSQAEVQEHVLKLKKHVDDKVFIHIARCSEPKNEPLLFRTFNKILNEGHHALLIIIGANYDSPENKHLLESAHDGIHWLGTKKNIIDYLSVADYFILSSKWEGLPISLLEAMSAGVIPVCTPAGGIPDVLSAPQLGFLSPTMEDNDFYDTVMQAMYHPEQVERKFIRQHFLENYSMEHCAKQYIKAFADDKD